jgi:hypothetical protein
MNIPKAPTVDVDVSTLPVNSLNFERLGKNLNKCLEKEFFFILGMPRSGTTWFQYLMNSHPNIVCNGETNFRKNWYSNFSTLVDQHNNVAKTSGDNIKTYVREQDKEFLTMTTFLMLTTQWVERDGGKDIRHIGERTPGFMAKYLQMWNGYFPESKFIHLIRDPRDTAVSMWFYLMAKSEKYKGNQKTLKDYKNIGEFINNYVLSWGIMSDRARQAGSDLGKRYTEIRYEALNIDPYSTLSTVFDFLSADSSTEVVRDCVVDNSFEILSTSDKNRDRLFRKGLVGDWKNHYDESQMSQNIVDVLGRFDYV